MQDLNDFTRVEGEVAKIRYNLENTEMTASDRLKVLNVLRYDLSLLEDRDKTEKVRYNAFTKELEYSESVQIGKVIAMHINVFSTCIRVWNTSREAVYCTENDSIKRSSKRDE